MIELMNQMSLIEAMMLLFICCLVGFFAQTITVALKKEEKEND